MTRRGRGRSREYKFQTSYEGKQVATYKEIVAIVIDNIRDNYDKYVAQALEELTPYDFEKEDYRFENNRPTRSRVADLPDDGEDSNQGNDSDRKMTRLEEIEYLVHFKLWCKRKEAYEEQKEKYEDNMRKAYAYIFRDYCSREMKVAIEELPDFETKIRNNPIVLLQKVQLLMLMPIRGLKHPNLILIEIMDKLLNFCQNNLSLEDYLHRFRELSDIFARERGKNFLDGFVEKSAEYQDATTDEMRTNLKRQAFDEFLAMAFMCGSNQDDYGELMQYYRLKYSLGNDFYPKTLYEAYLVMSQNRTVRCFVCGSTDHRVKKCPMRDDIPRKQWYNRTKKMHCDLQSD